MGNYRSRRRKRKEKLNCRKSDGAYTRFMGTKRQIESGEYFLDSRLQEYILGILADEASNSSLSR